MRPGGTSGYSLIELLLVLAGATTLASLALPLTTVSTDAGKARQAASFVATRLRLARQQAVARTTTVGLVFDMVNGR